MKCKLCGGQCGRLGVLGNLIWLQCRNCGMQFNKQAKRRAPKGEKKKQS